MRKLERTTFRLATGTLLAPLRTEPVVEAIAWVKGTAKPAVELVGACWSAQSEKEHIMQELRQAGSVLMSNIYELLFGPEW